MIEIDNSLNGLLNRDDAARKCFLERVRGGTAVFTNGVFDILHRGHLEYLQAARNLGNILIVGLNSDESVRKIKGPKRPLVDEMDRAAALLALKSVNYVVIFDEETPAELIATLAPSILVKGGDYRIEEIVGYESVVQTGGRVVTIPFREGYSTTGLIEKILESYRP
jgi:D-beta-D-heptose 7-phosphate kinase/D-beta-D-heptose 1-phosphate adenosyltransferase